jgi:hypothetical protein
VTELRRRAWISGGAAVLAVAATMAGCAQEGSPNDRLFKVCGHRFVDHFTDQNIWDASADTGTVTITNTTAKSITLITSADCNLGADVTVSPAGSARIDVLVGTTDHKTAAVRITPLTPQFQILVDRKGNRLTSVLVRLGGVTPQNSETPTSPGAVTPAAPGASQPTG